MIMHRPDPAAAIRSLRSAAPYIRMYKGKTFVVKAGGGVFADSQAVRGLIEQIAILHYFGVRVVFVHGGGPQLTEVTEKLGVPTRMVQGRRVTDQGAIDATSMVLNGLINTQLLSYCREMNIDAVGVSGVDAGLVRAHKRGPVKVDGETVDYGFVGDIDQIDPTVLNKLLDNGLMQVRVLAKGDNRIRTVVLTAGRLGSRRHINLPGVDVNLPALTEKDRADIGLGIELRVDFVALSFGVNF